MHLALIQGVEGDYGGNMKLLSWLFLSAAWAAMAVGCGDDDDDTDPMEDGSVDDGSVEDGGDSSPDGNS